MSIATSKLLLTIVLAVWLLTLFRSFTIMIGGRAIFSKASKGEKSALVPILNLFSMLEIVDISTYFGILFFVPILNLFVLTAMSYKLGTVFKTSFFYKIALVLLPIVFYPLLGKSNKIYKFTDENFFRALDSVKEQSVNLLTQQEIEKDVETKPYEDETPDVDSVFKKEEFPELISKNETYKAAKIDLLGMEKLRDDGEHKDLNELLKPQEQINYEKINNEIKKDDNDDIEMLDL